LDSEKAENYNNTIRDNLWMNNTKSEKVSFKSSNSVKNDEKIHKNNLKNNQNNNFIIDKKQDNKKNINQNANCNDQSNKIINKLENKINDNNPNLTNLLNEDPDFSFFDINNPEFQKELLIDEIIENKKELVKLQKDSNNTKYMNEMHKYNETKDIAQEILGNLALYRNISIRELYEDLGISDNEN